MIKKELGKIKRATYGFGGYQEAQFGISFTFGGEWGGVGTFWGEWADPPPDGAEWTVEDQDIKFANTTRKIIKIMQEAKVTNVTKLVGTPVEVVFDGNTLKDWRVLTEVL